MLVKKFEELGSDVGGDGAVVWGVEPYDVS